MPNDHSQDPPAQHPPPSLDSAPKKIRLSTIDVFRGLTMGLMVLVNNPGSWEHIYPPLRHAQWHGCTPTDLVFPFFLFIIGTSMAFASPAAVRGGAFGMPVPTHPWMRLLRRTLLLLGLGLLLSGFPYFHLDTLRFPGILQRIALCGLALGLIVHWVTPRRQIALAVAILLGYWGLLTIAAPEVLGDTRRAFETLGQGSLSNTANLPRWVDLQILGQAHTWIGSPTDPEGLLSTLPSIVTALAGFWTGRFLRDRPDPSWRTAALLAGAGLAAIAAGWVWSFALPLNKALWTSSYTVLSAGWALLALAVCYAVADVLRWQRLVFPLVVLGMNAIFLFVGSGLVGRLLTLIKIPAALLPAPLAERPSPTLKGWLYESLCVPLAQGSPINGSLLFALLTLAGWFALLLAMHRRRWFLKV